MATPKLNPEQDAAVRYLDGPLLVLAGAGSGKTGVITRKIAHLIQRGYAGDRIAAVTFTNKAAREMKQRASKLIDSDAARGLTVSTFHSLGLQMIRAEHAALGYKPRFSIFDAEDADKLLADLIGKDAELRKTARFTISAWKSALVDPEGAAATAAGSEQAIARAYAEYQRRLKAYNAVDFDDLLSLPVQLLREDAAARERWQNRFRYLLVDEYQDTNAAQYELMRLLAGVRAAFTVVGDDDQSIYAWRGARPGNIADLSRDFPHLKVIKLEQNYRSVGNVLSAANTLISSNARVYEKNLWSAMGPGDRIRVLACADEAGEADRVASEISSHRLRTGNAFGDYAVLYRGNFQSRAFEKAMRERQIPYRVSGGRSFFERSEIRDLAAYLKLLVNPDDDAAFLRVVNLPRREIGPATLEALARYAGSRHLSLFDAARGVGLAGGVGDRAGRRLAEFVDWAKGLARDGESTPAKALVVQLIADIDYREWLRDTAANTRAARKRLENVDEFLAWLGHMEENTDGTPRGLDEVVRRLSLMDFANQSEKDIENQVHLLTLHAAKGLEFDHVFLVGMEEGLLPHHACMDDEKIEEERRLLYVGITRARKTLSLSYARQRRRGGENTDSTPSRFLEELPKDEIEWPQSRKRDPKAEAEHGRNQLAALKAMLGDSAD
ncbi:ATP-dependent DNA helicase rep protein [Salinisphaera shabanensis E1L3A]|uniref:ATP-dependent DNA helicase Rep n=1 Tax=Salinisphaera shabanensis E1L3A TaxID=1033802 RepID=U2EN75_9GAMM|nr:UvrD-helicase domain-containing protein [Salinisphaera shabanensis]ERJ19577.1 ATP-dependent DNA helicase rep protein [Salinisphaera shabanensis E1L3A]